MPCLIWYESFLLLYFRVLLFYIKWFLDSYWSNVCAFDWLLQADGYNKTDKYENQYELFKKSTVSRITFDLPEKVTTVGIKCRATVFTVYDTITNATLIKPVPRRLTGTETLLRSGTSYRCLSVKVLYRLLHNSPRIIDFLYETPVISLNSQVLKAKSPDVTLRIGFYCVKAHKARYIYMSTTLFRNFSSEPIIPWSN